MEKVIESIGLTLHGVDGKIKEIPLELWQVDIICQILGLTVKIPDLDNYEMSPKDRVMERMELYKKSIKNIPRD
jgi:hypothetical protein